MVGSWDSVKVDGSDMSLYASLPASGGPVPGIIVVHGQSGLESFIKDTTHMLALQGYAAVAPNLYHRDGPDCGAPRAYARSTSPRASSGETLRSVSSFAKATEDTLFAFIHGLTPVAFCEGG